MKTLSAGLKAHLATETPQVAYCWKIVRADSTVMGFTAHDEDITYDGVTYAASTGFAPSAISNTSNLAVDNLDVQAILDSSAITEADLIAGVYDYAEIYLFLVCWSDLTLGDLPLQRGILGEVTIKDGTFVAEMRSLSQKLTQTIGRTHGPDCDASLGDTRCGVTLASYTHTGTITTVTDNANFADSSQSQADDYFNYGKITWTSGNNNGRSMEIKDFANSGGVFELFQAMPSTVQVGDTYSAHAGCDRLPATCKTTFSNFDNFQGFPHIPGIDKQLEYPDAN